MATLDATKQRVVEKIVDLESSRAQPSVSVPEGQPRRRDLVADGSAQGLQLEGLYSGLMQSLNARLDAELRVLRRRSMQSSEAMSARLHSLERKLEDARSLIYAHNAIRAREGSQTPVADTAAAAAPRPTLD